MAGVAGTGLAGAGEELAEAKIPQQELQPDLRGKSVAVWVRENTYFRKFQKQFSGGLGHRNGGRGTSEEATVVSRAETAGLS